MTTETDAVRIQKIKMRTGGLIEFEKDIGSQDVNITKVCEDLQWLIERTQELEKMRSIVAEAHQDNLEKKDAENARLQRQIDEDYIPYIEQLEQENLKLRRLNEIKVIKQRGERFTVIEYLGERYVYQSESTARGGISRKKKSP